MSAASKTNYLMPQSNLDTEYNALRRRMSRCRVKEGGKLSAVDDMDIIEEDDEEDYRDLIKFWKKHNVGFAKEMLPAVQKRNAAKKASKNRGAGGRRKSIEFEDLEQGPTGNLSLPVHLRTHSGFRKTGSGSIIEEEDDSKERVSSARKQQKSTSKQHTDFVSQRSNSKISSNKNEHRSEKPSVSPKKHVFKRAESDSVLMKTDSTLKPIGKERKISQTSGESSPKTPRERKTSQTTPSRSSSLKKK